MKKIFRAAACAAAIAVSVSCACGYGQTLQSIEDGQPQLFIDAVETYIYGYPLMMIGVTVERRQQFQIRRPSLVRLH